LCSGCEITRKSVQKIVWALAKWVKQLCFGLFDLLPAIAVFWASCYWESRGEMHFLQSFDLHSCWSCAF
jgi:hypothetical protein